MAMDSGWTVPQSALTLPPQLSSPLLTAVHAHTPVSACWGALGVRVGDEKTLLLVYGFRHMMQFVDAKALQHGFSRDEALQGKTSTAIDSAVGWPHR